MTKSLLGIFFLVGLILLLQPTFSAADSQVFEIPRIEGVSIEGEAGDWASEGFRVHLLIGPDGNILSPDDFDVKFRMGWNAEGLLILAVVRDDHPQEHQRTSQLWRCDCLEVFVADAVGSDNRYQVIISSGADPTYKRMRHHIYDWRPERQRNKPLTVQAASRRIDGEATIEILLPWRNLGVEPELGLELGFQLVAHDFEGNSGHTESFRVGWYPGLEPANPRNMYGVRLSEDAGEAVLFRAWREITPGRCGLSVLGASELVGLPVEVMIDSAHIYEGKMELHNGRAVFHYAFPERKDRESWPAVKILLDGRVVSTFPSLPTLEAILTKYEEALGGRKHLSDIRTRKLVGELVHDFPGRAPQTTRFPVEVDAGILDSWKLVIHSQSGRQQMGCDGTHGWIQDNDRILIDNHQKRSRLAYVFDPQGVLRFEEYYPELNLTEKRVFEGRQEYVVKARKADGTLEWLFFDAESGLLRRLGGDLEIQEYGREQNVLFPKRIFISREGGSSRYAFREMRINPSLEPAHFAVPDLDDVFPDAFEGLADSPALPLLKAFPSGHEDMNVPCRDGRFLHDFIVENGYRKGLEIGTFTGYSALWMGLAFEKTGGRLITIEIDPSSGREARANIQKAELNNVVDSRIADAFKEISEIEGMFDFVFIDAWKPDYVKFLGLLRDRVTPGGAIVAHNVTNYAQDMRDYLEAIGNDPGLVTSFKELSAEGMSISIVDRSLVFHISSLLPAASFAASGRPARHYGFYAQK